MGVGKYVIKRAVVTPPTVNYGAGVFAPAGWGDAWRTYRDGGAAAERREVVVFGDSTSYGSGGNYSYVQRVRDRSVAAGITDGGKGMFGKGESAITYDAPEVNGFVSTTFTGSTSSHDSLVGQYWYSGTAGQTLTVQARTTAFRLWYVDRSDNGTFTYAVDGGTAITAGATATGGDPLDRFVYVSGLTADTTHTVVITNRGGRGTTPSGSAVGVTVAIQPVNAVGVVYSKQATSGGAIQGFFHEPPDTDYTGPHIATRYQAPLGLVPTSGSGSSPTSADAYVANNVVDTSYSTDARVRPILAFFNLGFNDFSGQASTNYSLYTEGIRKFAAACRTTGCDGIVSTGNMPVNANWPTYGAGVYNAMKNQAATEGLAFVDMWEPFGGALDYTGGTADPHLTKAKYVQQGDYLWDGLLSV